MSPDEIAKLKAALMAAGDQVVNALTQVEQQEIMEKQWYTVDPTASSTADAYASLLYSKPLCIIDFGVAMYHADLGKTALATILDYHFDDATENSLPPPVADYVEHAIIAHLQSGDTIALAKLNAAFPTDDEHVFEVPQLERMDAAIHPLSIYNFNGRSLDSHNPWHLTNSFESYLDAELRLDDAARIKGEPSNPRIPSEFKDSFHDIHNDIGLIESESEVTNNRSAFNEVISRNNVTDNTEALRYVEHLPLLSCRILSAC